MEATCQLHNRTAFPSGKETRYGFHTRLGGHHSRFGRFGAETDFMPFSQPTDVTILN